MDTHAHKLTHPSLRATHPLLTPAHTTHWHTNQLECNQTVSISYFCCRAFCCQTSLSCLKSAHIPNTVRWVGCKNCALCIANISKTLWAPASIWERIHPVGTVEANLESWKCSVFLPHWNTLERISPSKHFLNTSSAIQPTASYWCEWWDPLLFTAPRQELILLLFAELLIGHWGVMKHRANQNTPLLPVFALLRMKQTKLWLEKTATASAVVCKQQQPLHWLPVSYFCVSGLSCLLLLQLLKCSWLVFKLARWMCDHVQCHLVTARMPIETVKVLCLGFFFMYFEHHFLKIHSSIFAFVLCKCQCLHFAFAFKFSSLFLPDLRLPLIWFSGFLDNIFSRHLCYWLCFCLIKFVSVQTTRIPSPFYVGKSANSD